MITYPVGFWRNTANILLGFAFHVLGQLAPKPLGLGRLPNDHRLSRWFAHPYKGMVLAALASTMKDLPIARLSQLPL